MQAPATNLAPKPIKVLSMLDYVPSTEPLNHAESGRRLGFVLNLSPARSGKYRPGNPPDQRLLVRMPKVDKAPLTVRVKVTAVATSAAIKVPPPTLPILPVHQLPRLPYLPSRLKRSGHRCLGPFLIHPCIQLLCQSYKHSAESRVHGASQDIVHLCAFIRVDIKSLRACEEPPYCTQQTWRLGLFLLGTRGPTATQYAGSSCISSNDVFTSTYYSKVSHDQ